MNHDCERVSEGFPDLLFGEAEPGARAALLEEVARCERCAREYRTLAETLRSRPRVSGRATGRD